jgi:hypothetical protein
MDQKRYQELREKMARGEPVTQSELRDLEVLESRLLNTLTPEQRVQNFEATCKIFGVKPAHSFGIKKNKP